MNGPVSPKVPHAKKKTFRRSGDQKKRALGVLTVLRMLDARTPEKQTR